MLIALCTHYTVSYKLLIDGSNVVLLGH